MTKSSGPRTEEVCQEDRSVSHFTRKQRDDRYDLNQLRTEPWIPNQDERRKLRTSNVKQSKCETNAPFSIYFNLSHFL